jgi:hypothetical protein
MTLREQNEILRKLLLRSMDETTRIVASRFAKNGQGQHDDYTLGYGACVEEVTLRVNELHQSIIDDLVTDGVISQAGILLDVSVSG